MKLLMACVFTLFSSITSAEAIEDAESRPSPPPMTREELQSVFDRVAEGCKDHFDVRPYYDLAMDQQDSPRVTPGVLESLKSFGDSGRIELPAEKADDLVARRCVTFAEGLVAGGVGHSLVHAFVTAAAEFAAKAVEAFAGPLMKIFAGIFGLLGPAETPPPLAPPAK